MPTCQNCQTTWTWKDAFKKQFNLMGIMTCPYCGKKQYYSARFRKRSGAIPFIMISIIMLGNLLFGPSKYILGLLPIIVLGIFIFSPFFIELSNEEEPLF